MMVDDSVGWLVGWLLVRVGKRTPESCVGEEKKSRLFEVD